MSRPLEVVRERIAAMVKTHPDDSHGGGYTNHGLKMALGVIDRAMDAPCRPRPRMWDSGPYDQWCELHGSHQNDGAERCNGHRYVADQAL